MGAGGVRRAERRRIRLLSVSVALIVGLAGCSEDTSVTPPRPPGDATGGRAIAAQQVLSDLEDAVASRDVARAAALGVAGARPVLDAMAHNAGTLDLSDVSLRYVDDESTLSDNDRALYGSTAWPANVELTYRLTGWDEKSTRVETRVVFRQANGRELIAGIGGGDGRTPLWVTGPVQRLAAGRALVIARGDKGQRDLALARHALADVAKVLPAWRGNLVIEDPATQDELDQVLGAPRDQYANIAAVTASVDGSLVPGSPVHVFLNPSVFGPLGPRGSQVVISHESTHVATDATFADMPTWLLEGFADYVALAHAGIPVDTAASQELARIRKHGPPDNLPTAADLDPTASGLGATYEEAWLANRFIAREYGEAKLVRFYFDVSNGTNVSTAFRNVLGTTQAGFVKRWRADLRDLAGGVEG